MKDAVLAEAKRLCDLGLTVHWLHARDKRPVEPGWTVGKKKTFEELLAGYRAGRNVGVRLGDVINGKILSVIDCDVKSSEQKHLIEMEQKLIELVGGDTVKSAPTVLSGRGRGSRHLYVFTVNAISSRRLSQSSEKVKVLLFPKGVPAQEPTKADREALSETELANGYRMRAAWEIDFMSAGKQVAVPPSIHPLGGTYSWELGRELLSLDVVPVLDSKRIESVAATRARRAGKLPDTIHQTDFGIADLVLFGVDEELSGLLEFGVGCEGDKSASMFKAARGLIKAGIPDADIVTLLLDPSLYFAGVAYTHTKQTKSWVVAATWVWRYVIEPARRKFGAENDFDGVEIVDVVLSEAEAKAQADDLGINDWQRLIQRSAPTSGAKPKANYFNISLILRNVFCDSIVKTDLFARREVWGQTTPWAVEGMEVTDGHAFALKKWLQEQWEIDAAPQMIHDSLSTIAAGNNFHPVREYLNGLVWDGIPRVDSWLRQYIGAEAPEPYLSEISRKFLCAMVARVFEPGCKFDTILILEGLQGVGKSTFCSILAGPEWFTDAHLDPRDKDAVVTMWGRWLVEFAELSSLRRADLESTKAFLSRQVDRVRVAYGRRMVDYPRQCVFIGTTNAEEYLQDETGNRRFWPVRIGELDFEGLKAARNQLFAEAVHHYLIEGEKLWIAGAAAKLAASEQAARKSQHPWFEILIDDIERNPEFYKKPFRVSQLFGPMGVFERFGIGRAQDMNAASVLREAGFSKSWRMIAGQRSHWWAKN